MGGWLYFGCGPHDVGHYAFTENGWTLRSDHPLRRVMNHLDGTLQPQPEAFLYVAAFSRLGGWNMSALAWWDRSQDKRPASNSTILAPGLDWLETDMLAEAEKRFPWVFERLPKPLTLLSEGPSHAPD